MHYLECMLKIVKYGAPWCKYCNELDDLLHELNVEYTDINVDDKDHFEECRNFTVIPVLRFYDEEGNLYSSHVGAIGKMHLQRMISGVAKK